MKKNKKIIITVVFAVVCVLVILAGILISNSIRGAGAGADTDTKATGTFASLEDAVSRAGFPLQTTDRLNGILITDYSSSDTEIKVTYGKAGYVTKTLNTEDEETTGKKTDTENTDETTEDRITLVINGVTVRFTGDESAVTKAEWTDNGFDYAIVLTDKSVSAVVMTDYVSVTR